MILIVFETLVVKGLWTIGHWVAAHGSGAMAVKAGTVVGKSIATQGLANTVAGVTSTAIVSGLAVGTVIWTTEGITILQNALVDLQAGNYIAASVKLARLVQKLHIDVEFLPEVVERFLEKYLDFTESDAHKIGQVIANLEDEIIKQMK